MNMTWPPTYDEAKLRLPKGKLAPGDVVQTKVRRRLSPVAVVFFRPRGGCVGLVSAPPPLSGPAKPPNKLGGAPGADSPPFFSLSLPPMNLKFVQNLTNLDARLGSGLGDL